MAEQKTMHTDNIKKIVELLNGGELKGILSDLMGKETETKKIISSVQEKLKALENAKVENAKVEKVEEKIEMIEFSISTTRSFIKIIDDAIATLKDDKYFDLIELRYFKGRSREDIAEHFDCDVSTVNRNKNRLINLLQIILFSDEVIQQIFAS
jgi:RNA polymerase sigma factor (sigma-70 family)